MNKPKRCCLKVKKALVVGLGSIGRRHIEILKEIYPDVKIALLRHNNCELDENETQIVDDCYTDYKDALMFKPDVAIISNPATLHIDIALKCAAAGIHLFVEKPIAADILGVQKLIDLCHNNGVMLMTAYNLRFLPSLNYLNDVIQQGKIGNILSVRAEVGQYLPNWRPGSDYRQSVSAQKKLGGGVLTELSHEVDYLLWLFGDVEWVTAHLSHQSNLEIDVEDTVYILLGFKQTKSCKPLTASLNMDFIRHDTTRKCEVIGEKGTLIWNAVIGKVEYFSERGNAWEELFIDMPEVNFTYREQIKHFISCVEKGTAPYVSGVDGLKALTLIDAVKKSNSLAQRVYIE